MKLFFTLILFALLLAFSWPLALLVLIMWPIVWLISIPFRFVAVILRAMLALVTALLFLPARLLGFRESRT